jgi:hypothetical protein
MTTQEIRDLIAKKIAGQGTQVDLGNGLPAILNGILDAVEGASMEPLIVEGTNSDSRFSESAGQPTFSEALEAFNSGRPVFLHFLNEESNTEETVLITSHSVDEDSGEHYLRARGAEWIITL